MPLVSQSLPSLFNGVSQQAAAARLPSQAELQENAYSNMVDGLIKRPPSVHKAALGVGVAGLTSANIFTTVFNENEKYVVAVSNQDVKVFDFNGVPQVVNTPSGLGYLNVTNARLEIKAVTVADYTFLVNTSIKTSMGVTATATEAPSAYVWIKTGVQDQTYTVDVGSSVVSYTAGGAGAPATFRTTTIANDLRDQLNLDPAITAVASGSVIKITRTDGADFTFDVSDSWGNQASLGIKGTVQKFSDLPPTFWEGVTIEVTGTGSTENLFDSLYVNWVKGTTTGTWKETVKPGLINDIDASTMPHVLVKELDGTFTFKPSTWDDRAVGDANLSPEPSFIGSAVTDVFFYKNRLGFLSEENAIMSRSGEYFNFWPETVTEVLDSDPIDIASTNTKISLLQHAVPFNESLLVFSKNSQFSLNHDNVVSPASVSLDVTTEFASSVDSKPVGAGTGLFFVVENGNYSGLREYYVADSSVSNNAVNLTAHVPNYLPRQIHKLTASNTEDVLFVLSSMEPNVVYVYKHFWDGQQRVQSSWSRWVFSSTDNILGIEIVGTELMMVVERADDVYLESVDVQAGLLDTGLSFQVHLDRKVALTGTYDAATTLTTWTLPYPGSANTQVVLGGSFTNQGGKKLVTSAATSTTVTASGDFSAGIAYLGDPYSQRYVFSEQFIKDDQGSPLLTSSLQLRRFHLSYLNSGYFKVEVTPPDRGTYTYEFTGKFLGKSSLVLGQQALESGSFSVPVIASSVGIKIEIINDTHFPSRFQSAEWEGFFQTRNKRM
jgi:hypothetical protein